MSAGFQLVFVSLHFVLKALDYVFWVFRVGLVSVLFKGVGFVARVLLSGEDGAGAARRSSGRDATQTKPIDPNTPPDPRVVEASKGDAQKLREKHRGWLMWRAGVEFDTLMTRPRPGFEIVKAFYPHAFHTNTKGGFAVHVEKPGQFPRLLKELKNRGFANPTQVVVEHVSFVMSHAFDTIDKRDLPHGRVLRIVDMSRLDLSDTGFEAYKFLKEMANVSSLAFPERVHKVVIVNPPAAFNLLWSVFSPMVSERTMARVRICGTIDDTREALLEDLPLCDIPVEYGGTCDCGAQRARNGTRFVSNGKNSSSDKETAVYDGGGAPLRDCPAARCSSCWRDAELERTLWNRVALANGGHGGVAGISGRGMHLDAGDDTANGNGGVGDGKASSPKRAQSRVERRGSKTNGSAHAKKEKEKGDSLETKEKLKRRDRGRATGVPPRSLTRGNVVSLAQSGLETVLVGARLLNAPESLPDKINSESTHSERDDTESNGSWFFG